VALGCFPEEREVESCVDAVLPCREANDCGEGRTFCEELPTCDDTDGDQPCVGEVTPDVGATCDPAVDGDAALCVDNATLVCLDDDDDGAFAWTINVDCDEQGGVCQTFLRGEVPGGCDSLGPGDSCLVFDPAQPGLGLCTSGNCVGQRGSTPGVCE